MYKLTVLLKYRDMCRCTVIMKGGGKQLSGKNQRSKYEIIDIHYKTRLKRKMDKILIK